jgi:hypothetical protein
MDESTIALDLTWTELDHHVAGLAGRVREHAVPDAVVGILRGGMVAAVLLAHQLGVRDVRGVVVTRTLSERPNGEKSQRPVITNPASLGVFTKAADVLLVDDVAGSGATLETVAGLLGSVARRVRRAVVVVNTVNWNLANSRAPHEVQDYIGTTCAGWVRFPWEVR